MVRSPRGESLGLQGASRLLGEVEAAWKRRALALRIKHDRQWALALVPRGLKAQ